MALALAVMPALVAGQARGVDNWTGYVSENWSVHGNWESGIVPVAGDFVSIGQLNLTNNVVNFDANYPVSNALEGLLVTNGNVLSMAPAAQTLSTNSFDVAYTLQPGGIAQAGGTINVTGSGDNPVGENGSGSSGGYGFYNMTGGTLTFAANNTLSIGEGGSSGYFSQSGGLVSMAAGSALNVNSGSYTLGGNGSLTVTGQEVVSVGSTITQSGGSNATTILSVANGTYTLNAGSLSAGSMTNSGDFNISGGSVNGSITTTGTVEISGSALIAGSLAVNAVGSVTQTGGLVSATVETLGSYFLLGGTFNPANDSTVPVNGPGASFTESSDAAVTCPTFLNLGIFNYEGGAFTGRLVNQGTVNLNVTGAVFGNGLENDGALTLASSVLGVVATFNGQGLDNFSSIYIPAGEAIAGNITNDFSGTLSGPGEVETALNNLGTLLPGNGMTITGLLTNSGLIGPISYGVQLKADGGITNTGTIQLEGGQITGGNIINNPGGVLQFINGTTVEGFGVPAPVVSGLSQAVNNSGGVIEIGSGTLVTFSSFSAGNTNGGDIQIANNSSFAVTTAFPNSGTIELGGSSAALNGGAITNTGSISGQGRISNPIYNSGTIESKAGLLQISGTGSTNLTGAQIIADAGTTVQFSQGLAVNGGTITLFGGTFDNNSRALINTGLINGSGTFRTGGAGLNNSTGAIIDITAGTSIFGPVSNSGYITAYGSTNTFYGNVTDASGGTIKVTNGTIYFLGNTGATVSGLYNSDPSSNYFNSLTTTSTGTVTGGSGDRFYLLNGTTLTNAGTFRDGGTLSAAAVINSGSFTQTGTLIETGNFTNSGTVTIGGMQNWSHGTVFTNTAGTATFQSDAGATGENLSLNVIGGSVVLASKQQLAGLTVGGGGVIQITGGGNGNRSMVYTPSLSDSGTVDLTGNDLDIQNGGTTKLAAVTALIAEGYNNGSWTGTGMTSSTAAADTTHLTALGAILNTSLTTLDGQSVASNDVLLKYTYYGDSNLDGRVDGSDYSRIDNGYLSHLTGWSNGDFNYDGVVDGSDYTLIDNAFNTQGAQLSAEIASATAQLAASSETSVPEPATLGFLVLGTIGLLSRRADRQGQVRFEKRPN